MLNLTFKTRKPRPQQAQTDDGARSRPLSVRFDVFIKTSVKNIFTKPKHNKAIEHVNNVSSAPLPLPAVRHNSNSVQRPYVFQVDVIMDAETLKGLECLYEALHDPSILDARRHRRYNLYPLVISVTAVAVPIPVIAEKPASVSSSSSPELLNVLVPPQPRFRRSLVLYEISASTIRSSPEAALALDYPSSFSSRRSLSSPSSSSSIVFAPSSSSGSNSDSNSNSQPLLTVPTRTHSQQTANDPLLPSTKTMNINSFQILRFLGSGTSGQVYHVQHQLSKARVALKVVPKAKKSEYTISVVIKERDISVKLRDSPWFVGLWAAWHDDANLYIAMTAYPTDLDSEMIRCGVIEPERARFYMAEIIIALEELHSRGIIHRDIKSPNILISHAGHIVLADFGLSKDFALRPTIAERVYQPYWPYLRDENPTSETEPRDPAELFFVSWDYRGSELEMAPEVHLRQPYSFGVDFWSAAVVLYWMLTGRPPFYEDEEEYEDGGEADVKPLPYKIAEDDLYWDPEDNVDEETIDFLERMLTKSPQKRLMISYEMPAHPYFAGVNWTLMEQQKVPPPWIPECEVCHVYEQSSPNFVPGKPFADVDSDPYPEFNYMSEEAARAAAIDSNGEDEDDSDNDEAESDSYSSESDSDSDTATDVEIMCIGSYEDLSFGYSTHPSTAPTTPDRADNHEARTLLCGGSTNNGGDPIKQSWDLTIISPPATKPVGPGPKQWFRAQDLVKLVPNPSPAALPVVSAPQVQPCFIAAAETTLSIAPESGLCTPPSRLTLVDAQVLPCQKQTRIVNGTGILFKVKVWLSRLWTPKPKPRSGLKRLSLLS